MHVTYQYDRIIFGNYLKHTVFLFKGFMEQQNKTVIHNGTELRNSLLSCTKGSWQVVPAPAKLH